MPTQIFHKPAWAGVGVGRAQAQVRSQGLAHPGRTYEVNAMDMGDMAFVVQCGRGGGAEVKKAVRNAPGLSQQIESRSCHVRMTRTGGEIAAKPDPP